MGFEVEYGIVAWSLDMSFKAGIRASRLKCGLKGWDLGFKVGNRVLRLGFGFQGGSDLGFEVKKGIEFDMVSGPRRIR